MRNEIPPALRSYLAVIDHTTLRFVLSDELGAEVRVVLSDVLTVAGYPPVTRRQVLKSVPAADLRTVAFLGRKMLLSRLATARALIMRAAELDHCPAYQADVFEVVASYARDQLQSGAQPVRSGILNAFSREGGE